MKVLIDTCVIIDVLQSREPFCESAQKLFMLAANRQFDGYITAKSVTEIYYISHRSSHNDILFCSAILILLFYSRFDFADQAVNCCARTHLRGLVLTISPLLFIFSLSKFNSQ